MAFRDQPLGELALTIPRAPPCPSIRYGLLLRRQTDPGARRVDAKRWMSR